MPLRSAAVGYGFVLTTRSYSIHAHDSLLPHGKCNRSAKVSSRQAQQFARDKYSRLLSHIGGDVVVVARLVESCRRADLDHGTSHGYRVE